MMEFTKGDIIKANAEALVNTVNCVGVMGRGIALQFKKAFPENYKLYKNKCDKHQLHPGKLIVHDLNRYENPKFIINFPTKRHWKGKSRIEDIELGLIQLIKIINQYDIKSVAIPPLGCGLGGLNWNDVKPLIINTLDSVEGVHVTVYEPHGAPSPEKMIKAKNKPKMTLGTASLIGLMKRYTSALLDPTISLLEIHKLMYFMQDAGESLKLSFQKGLYGPYAKNLRHVLSNIEGHYIIGYGDATDDPHVLIEFLPNAIKEADEYLFNYPLTFERFDRVSDLIKGFETPYGMEILATVHWVATRENALTLQEAIQRTYSWNKRKSSFPVSHITAAWNNLASKNWLPETKQ